MSALVSIGAARRVAQFRWCSRGDHLHEPRPKKARGGDYASLHHFESEVGGARCLDRACPPQFDPLRVEILEEPDAVAEQYGDEVDLHLVQQPGLQILSPQMPTFLSPAADRASSSAASIPAVTKVYVVPPCMGSGSRASCVTTITGIPNGGGSPHGSKPRSNIRFPITTAPVEA